MGWFNFNKRENTGIEEARSVNPITGTLRFAVFGNGGNAMTISGMKLATVYRCVNLVSNSIASLPLIPYNYIKEWKYIDRNSQIYNILNVQPNPFMSAFTFKKMIVVSVMLKGNAYIWIGRDNKTGNVTSLTLLNADNIIVTGATNDILYRDTVNNVTYDKSQIIHIMNYGQTMYRGDSVITYMLSTLTTGTNLDNYMKSLSGSGMMVSGILKPVAGASITPTKAQAAKDTFNSTISSLDANSVIVLDSGFDFQQISISPKDAKYLESSKLNSNQICKFFGVPPSMIYDEVGKYATAEQSQIDYLNNTLMPIIENMESEFFRKIYLPTEWNTKELKFDTTNLMRLDAASQASYYGTLFGMGALTVNEVRDKINAAYPATNGNKHFISTNLQELDNLIVNQVKPSNQTDSTNQIDNKLL